MKSKAARANAPPHRQSAQADRAAPAKPVQIKETKEAIEKIGADRVGEGNSVEDGALRPERGPFGKVANKLNVQGDVAEVVRGEDSPGISNGVKQPREGAERGDAEDCEHQDIPSA